MNGKPRVLVVDDETRFLQMIEKILNFRGYEVNTAVSAEKALDLYKKERYDLLVTDTSMKGMDGIELIRKIRQIEPKQPVIVMAGNRTEFLSFQFRQEMISLGISNNILLKPFSRERFLKRISMCIER